MADLGRYLPLSNRGGDDDESSVTNDWRVLVDQCLTVLVGILEPLQPEQWGATTLDGERRVLGVADQVAARLEGAGVRTLRGMFGALMSDARLEHDEAEPRSLLPRLRGLAAGSDRRRTIGDLTEVVVSVYDIAATLGLDVELPSTASGAVALARMTAAPTPIRAVAGGRTLRATDAEWVIGRGPELAAPASELVLFLVGRLGRMPG